MTETLLPGVLGGGIAAALISIGFNVYWDKRKQAIAERWEHRKYEANLRHQLLFAITDIFYSSKNELFFTWIELDGFEQGLAVVRQQVATTLRTSNPQMPTGQVDALITQAVAPIQLWITQMDVNRVNQYNNSMKTLLARAEGWLSLAERIVATDGLYARMATVFKGLSRQLDVGKDGFKKRFDELEASEAEFKQIQKQLRQEIETALK